MLQHSLIQTHLEENNISHETVAKLLAWKKRYYIMYIK